ncbi:hypothetical protein IHE49_15140 [Rhodanobacter sp. 7MK24]|uniref:hypothetical protein n=1 Tax=Rhodanobacter sp. 7MK24 TaxID=2775922 RepID=UPI0017809BB0|nr:hypothetical protein [Rhodanobacter sp. 7MK24]MBD8881821.1 hypothetical protein [Rhodanobacter sp. 7MK24]
MRSPFVGLLLQHGHVHSPELVRQLTDEDQQPLPLRDAVKRLTTPEAAARRNSWGAVTRSARYLFLINSP